MTTKKPKPKAMPRARKPVAKSKLVPPSSLDTPETAKGDRRRATLFTPELGDKLAILLATGKTLTSICKNDPALPAASTVISWAIDGEHPFAEQYARARRVGYTIMGDLLLDDADRESTEAGAVARDRLKVDTRKWLLSKALPKIYGDKLEIDTPKDGGFAQAAAVTTAALQALVDRA